MRTFFQTRFIQSMQAYAYPTGILVCCIFAAWFAAFASNELSKEPSLALGNADQEDANNNQQRPTIENFTAIMTRNLLDVLTIAPKTMPSLNDSANFTAVTPEDVDAIPLSTQPWTLLGTIFDEQDNDSSRAIILVEDEEGLYAKGDKIQDWNVDLVQRGSVLLSLGAKQERLAIEGSASLLPDRPDIQKDLLRRRLQAVLRDIPTLMRALVVRPQQIGPRQGLGIVSIDNKTYLRELGLQIGDVLLSLDKKPLRGFGDLANFMTLVNNDTITLEIMRGGKPTIIRYHMKK